jgi:predicted lipoprotein with Yx(FWY)xxD motif
MKRFLAPAVIAIAAVAAGGIAIAATGSNDSDDTPAASAPADDDTSTPDAASASTADSPPTVTVIHIDGLGAVLTDTEGDVLYAADEEVADPDVICTDACEEFWAPLAASSEAPTGVAGVTGLDVAARPDGTQQVTHNGHRLYTFTLDEPGEASGEGFADTFDGQRFTWHAVVIDETAGDTAPVSGAATEATTAPSDTDVAGTSTADDIYDYPDN